MLSDEEKKEYEELKRLLYTGTISQYGKRKLIDIIEKQSKEIEHQKEKRENQKQELAILNDKQKEFNKLVNTVNSYKGQFKRQQKEIEELKENNKKLTDEYLIQRDLINPDFLKDYISKEEAEQKEKKAYIDGTNVAHELCNKMWKDKINAEISLLEIEKQEVKKAYPYTYAMCDEYRNADAQIEFGESLLEKEQ